MCTAQGTADGSLPLHVAAAANTPADATQAILAAYVRFVPHHVLTRVPKFEHVPLSRTITSAETLRSWSTFCGRDVCYLTNF